MGKTISPKSKNFVLPYKFYILIVLRKAQLGSLWSDCTLYPVLLTMSIHGMHGNPGHAFPAVSVAAQMFLFLVLNGGLIFTAGKIPQQRFKYECFNAQEKFQCVSDLIILCYMYSHCDSPLIVLTSYYDDRKLNECHSRVVVHIFLHN